MASLDRNLFKPELCACWIGSRGTITPLHFDTCHGLLATLVGTKRVTLFAPADTMYVRRRGPFHPNPNSSELTWEDFRGHSGMPESPPSRGPEGASAAHEYLSGPTTPVDDEGRRKTQQELYPEAHEATPIEVYLAPGETLYIPPGWWHHVEGVTPTVAALLPFDMAAGETLHPSLILR